MRLLRLLSRLFGWSVARPKTDRLRRMHWSTHWRVDRFQIFGFVMVIFFLISFPPTRLAARLEKRLV